MVRAVKWIGLVVAAILVAIGAASIWFDFTYRSRWPGPVFRVRHAALTVRWHTGEESFPGLNSPVASEGWAVQRHAPSLQLAPRGQRWPIGSTFTIHQWDLPLWLALVLIGAPTVWLWLRDRPVAPHACRACGYDLRGVGAGAVCPECGAAITRA